MGGGRAVCRDLFWGGEPGQLPSPASLLASVLLPFFHAHENTKKKKLTLTACDSLLFFLVLLPLPLSSAALSQSLWKSLFKTAVRTHF